MEKVLIVDDDTLFSSILSRALKKRGFEPHCADTQESAQALAEQYRFDKAIVDLKLEESTGLQLIPLLKQQQPHLTIVMLTGYSSISTAVEAIKLGASNYLCKPADADDILAAFNKTQGDSDLSISNKPHSVDRLEWEHIQKVLLENEGNISATARALGMHRRTLQRKLQKKPVKE